MLDWIRRIIQEFLKVDVLEEMQRHEGDALEDATFELGDRTDSLAKRMDWMVDRTGRMDDTLEEVLQRLDDLEGDVARFKNSMEYGPGGRIPNDF